MTMRVGIVGTGSMGEQHAAAWSKTPVQIGGFLKNTAVYTPLPEQFNSKRYTDFEALLADVDIVDICTPTHLHYEMVLQVAQAKKHIVCEKPLARTLEQAQEMIQICQDEGVQLFVAHVLRYFPVYQTIKAQVSAQKVGDLGFTRLNRHGTAPQNKQWFFDRQKSGGMLLDLMIHDFDYARWLAGEVTAVTAYRLNETQLPSMVEHAIVMLKHQNGTVSHIEGSWSARERPFSTSVEVGGSKGWLRFDSQQFEPPTIKAQQLEQPETIVPIYAPQADPYALQLQDFYNQLTQGNDTAVTAEDGLAALQIGLAALESVHSGQTVQL